MGSEEPVQLVMNQTQLALPSARNLGFFARDCNGPASAGVTNCQNNMDAEFNTCWCIKWELNTGPFSGLKLEIKWGLFDLRLGLTIMLGACAPAQTVFAIPAVGPVQAEMCVGGLFMFSLNILNCPYFPFDISGKIYFRLTFKIEADLGFASFEYDLAAIELGLEAGLSWYEGPNYNACTWVQEWDGFVMPGIPSQYQPFRRRRRNRRRYPFMQSDNSPLRLLHYCLSACGTVWRLG